MDNKREAQMADMSNGLGGIRLITIPEKFIEKFPDIAETKRKTYFNRYLSVMRKHLGKRLPFMNTQDTYLSLEQIFDDCGSFNYKKKRYYIYNEFKDLLPFYVVIETGNNLKKTKTLFEKNSRVKIMDNKYIEALIEGGNSEELVISFFGNLTDEQLDNAKVIDIDSKSLLAFLAICKATLETSCSDDYKNQVRKNYYQARYVQMIGDVFAKQYDRPVLPMIPTFSPYGRTYYQGINIMNMREEVRCAVLGKYHQYDLNAAVYVIKLMLAREILKKQNQTDFGRFTHTKDYLDRKSRIRIDLAKHCLQDMPVNDKIKVKIIKEAITAIGFGARIGAGSWQNHQGEWENPAINDIIRNKQDRERFINHDFVKNFVKEQKEMMDIIVDDYLSNKTFVEKVKDIKNMANNNGKIRRMQVMAYLYQQCEAHIMSNVETLAKCESIRIHDALITRTPITNENLMNIKDYLVRMDKDLTIEHEVKHAWLPIITEEEDDPRDVFVREQYRRSNKNSFNGNYQSYDVGCQMQGIEYDEDGEPIYY